MIHLRQQLSTGRLGERCSTARRFGGTPARNLARDRDSPREKKARGGSLPRREALGPLGCGREAMEGRSGCGGAPSLARTWQRSWRIGGVWELISSAESSGKFASPACAELGPASPGTLLFNFEISSSASTQHNQLLLMFIANRLDFFIKLNLGPLLL